MNQNLQNSIIGTFFAEIITLPICTLKTNYQNSNNRCISISQTFQSIYQNHGVLGFYKATVPALFSQIISTSSKYVLYKEFCKKNEYPKVINGIASGLLSSIVTHPLDVWKIYHQQNQSVKTEIKTNGISIFYRGYSKSIGKVIIASSLFLPLYDTFSSHYNAFTASILASITSVVVMHPMDFLKTRHIYNQRLFLGCDPRMYYKGLSLHLLRTVPHFMILMTTIEYLNKNIS